LPEPQTEGGGTTARKQAAIFLPRTTKEKHTMKKFIAVVTLGISVPAPPQWSVYDREALPSARCWGLPSSRMLYGISFRRAISKGKIEKGKAL
jgi:hypothetical protein